MYEETTIPATTPDTVPIEPTAAPTEPETVPPETQQETLSETQLATEPETVPTEEVPTEAVQETAASSVVEYEIPETTEFIPTEAVSYVTETTTPVYIDVIETASNDISHSTLFGSFLICGTLVGLTLFRGKYGS